MDIKKIWDAVRYDVLMYYITYVNNKKNNLEKKSSFSYEWNIEKFPLFVISELI